MRHWLVKSEPEVYSIDDLRRDRSTLWDAVRNYQARNYLKEIEPGDLVLFYHSNAEPSGVAGVAVAKKKAVADPLQFDRRSDYYDPKSTVEKPRWFSPTLSFKEKFATIVTLEQMRAEPSCQKLELLRRGSRLSVIPVDERAFRRVVELGNR